MDRMDIMSVGLPDGVIKICMAGRTVCVGNIFLPSAMCIGRATP